MTAKKYEETFQEDEDILYQIEQQQTGPKYVKAVYCHPAYYIHSTSCEMPGWMKHKLGSRLLGEISITSGTYMTPPLQRRTKEPLDEIRE